MTDYSNNENKKSGIKINVRGVVHYLLIYLMMQYHVATFYAIHQKYFEPFIITTFALFTLINYRKFKRSMLIPFLIILSTLIIMISLITEGSLGIHSVKNIIMPIFITSVIILYDKNLVLLRYVKFCYYLSLLSLPFFAMCRFNIQLASRLLPKYIGPVNDFYYGKVIYSMRYVYNFDTRNSSFFTEPGLFCVVLVAALYIMLFMGNELTLSKKKFSRYIIVFIITILTTLSAAGYISFGVVLIGFLVSKKSHGNIKHNKFKIIALISIVVFLLGLNNELYKDQSIINVYLFSKMDSTALAIEGNSGNARLATIDLSIASLLKNPLGVGMTTLVKQLPDYAVGARFTLFIAAFGVETALLFYFYILKEFYRVKKNSFAFYCFIISYIVLSSAQSQVFYSSLLMIPFYYKFSSVQYNNKHYVTSIS